MSRVRDPSQLLKLLSECSFFIHKKCLFLIYFLREKPSTMDKSDAYAAFEETRKAWNVPVSNRANSATTISEEADGASTASATATPQITPTMYEFVYNQLTDGKSFKRPVPLSQIIPMLRYMWYVEEDLPLPLPPASASCVLEPTSVEKTQQK